MKKSILLALLAVAGLTVFVDDVQARCCRTRCRNRSCGCVTACATGCSTCNAAAPVAAPVTVAQNAAPTGSNYQSFSYEPGAQPAPAAVAPAPVVVARQRTDYLYDTVLRGNKKVTGPNSGF